MCYPQLPSSEHWGNWGILGKLWFSVMRIIVVLIRNSVKLRCAMLATRMPNQELRQHFNLGMFNDHSKTVCIT